MSLRYSSNGSHTCYKYRADALESVRKSTGVFPPGTSSIGAVIAVGWPTTTDKNAEKRSEGRRLRRATDYVHADDHKHNYDKKLEARRPKFLFRKAKGAKERDDDYAIDRQKNAKLEERIELTNGYPEYGHPDRYVDVLRPEQDRLGGYADL